MALAAGAMKEAQVAFAGCISAQPVMLPDLISRLRSLLLSSARLAEGELLRSSDDVGPTTAQTAPLRVWRWDLTTDAMPQSAGPGQSNVATMQCADTRCFTSNILVLMTVR